MLSLRSLFLLDPEVTFLNHGSFGATPKPVFEEYQRWQRQIERQPVKFLGRDILEHMANARNLLAEYLGVAGQDVVYFPNPTTAGNVIARSLALRPGEEILSTDHAYGALDRTWRFVCQKSGADYIRHPIPLPLTSSKDVVESFWQGVTPRTRVIFIDHITSATALQFPIEPIIARARETGILTVIDGAHAPGQIPIDLTQLGADMYIGACHKWLCAPKGSAFLYARREIQPLLDPLVVSWGYEDPTYLTGFPFVNFHEWQGTRDMSAFLATPAAIRFQAENDWETVRACCRNLAVSTRSRINELTGLPALCPEEPGWFTQFFAARLPEGVNVEKLKIDLYENFRIEVPIHHWNGIPLIRVSFQGYNTQEDSDALINALENLL